MMAQISFDTAQTDDEAPGPRAELVNPAATVRFMLAGNAHVTFQSRRTDTRFTYRVRVADPRPGDDRAPPQHFERLGSNLRWERIMNVTVEKLSNDQRAAYDAIMRWVDRNPAPHLPIRSDIDFDDYSDEHDDPDEARYEGPPAELLTLGGYAGTGKSTLVSLVSNRVSLLAFCAYTGKASSVLKRKLKDAGTATVGTQPRRDGQPSLDTRPFCGTIHSLIYRPCECLEPTVIEVQKPCPIKDCGLEMRSIILNASAEVAAECAAGHTTDRKTFDALKMEERFVYAEKDEDGRCKFCGGKEWLRRDVLDRNYGLIIVDEASMVDDMMIRDLRSFGVPILAVGDHGQLPPVGGVGSLMKNPNLRLERIHRQAEGDPIIALSKMVREEGRLPENMPGDSVRFERLRFVERLIEGRYENASPERMLQMCLACYTNKRRVGLNAMVRRVRGVARKGNELPRKGEHVICLKNMKTRTGGMPVFNGMRGVLQSDAEPKINANGTVVEKQLVGTIAFPEDEIEPREFQMLRAQFGRDKTYQQVEELARETGFSSFSKAGALFDFGYAMTVHKMQGSQFDDVVVCAERPGPVGDEDWRRWLYTAVTRASKKLTVLR